MLVQYAAALPVRLSVCSSQGGVLSKRLNILSRKQCPYKPNNLFFWHQRRWWNYNASAKPHWNRHSVVTASKWHRP